MINGDVWWPLLLSTLAGLSTTIGAVLAISRTPDEATLAFLLGSAIGVMATVSGAELWWHKAVQQHNYLGITAAVAAGAVAFALLDPLLPKPREPQLLMLDESEQQIEPHAILHLDSEADITLATAVKRQGFAARQQQSFTGSSKLLLGSSGKGSTASSPRHAAGLARTISSSGTDDEPLLPRTLSISSHHEGAPGGDAPHLAAAGSTDTHMQGQPSAFRLSGGSSSSSRRSGGDSSSSTLAELQAHHLGLMRLGLLMAVTMSLHNLPEGFAVAFSAFTDVGMTMALAIAVHNIPEGLIIAVPIYAATNSKARAIGIAAASGLSEPLGALVALFVFRPFVTSLERLDYVLAFVGGIMLAVCALELWPEGRQCRQDMRMMQGMLLGSVVMGWTLYVGV